MNSLRTLKVQTGSAAGDLRQNAERMKIVWHRTTVLFCLQLCLIRAGLFSEKKQAKHNKPHIILTFSGHKVLI